MKRSTQVVLLVSGTVLGIAIGYLAVKNKGTIARAGQSLKDAVGASKHRVEEMSEEVALRTARLTNNPQVNQDWVSRQWESIGL